MTQPKQQIIALGGGGFPMEPENLLPDRYILEQSPHQTPKACFLPTASGDNDNDIRRFYDAYIQMDCRPCHLRLFFRKDSGRS